MARSVCVASNPSHPPLSDVPLQPDVLGSSDNSENDRRFFQLVHDVLERKGQVPLDEPSALISTTVPLKAWHSDASLRIIFLRNLAALLQVEREQIQVSSVRDGGFGAMLTVWFKLCELCVVAPSLAMSNLRVLAASGALYNHPHLPIKTVFFRAPAKFVKTDPSLKKLDDKLKLKAKVQAFSDVLAIRKMKLRLQDVSDGIAADNKELLLLYRLINNKGHAKNLVADYDSWHKRVALEEEEVKDIKAIIQDVGKRTRLDNAAADAQMGLAELKASKVGAAVKAASLKIGQEVKASIEADLKIASLQRQKLLKAVKEIEEQLNAAPHVGSSSHGSSHSSSHGSSHSSSHGSSHGSSHSSSHGSSHSSESSTKGNMAIKAIDEQVHHLQAILAEIQ